MWNILTSGGPASFIMPLQIGKTPIVVPRQHQFNEHVNDHQVEFARNVAQRMGTIISVEDINTLGDIITNYIYTLNPSSQYLKCRLYRSKWVQSITVNDVMESGQVVENPMIGAIPSKNEVQRELDDLLMSM